MSERISFGNWQLLKQMEAGDIVYAPGHRGTTLEELGLARRFGANHLVLTGLGKEELKRPCPPFPHLGRNPDPRCPRCDELPPISLGVGEGR